MSTLQPMSFFAELKRRNVFKVGIAYAVSTWILLQLTDVVTGILTLPEWAPQLILLILLVGFIPALILAWAFELTPDGVKLETGLTNARPILTTVRPEAFGFLDNAPAKISISGLILLIPVGFLILQNYV